MASIARYRLPDRRSVRLATAAGDIRRIGREISARPTCCAWQQSLAAATLLDGLKGDRRVDPAWLGERDAVGPEPAPSATPSSVWLAFWWSGRHVLAC
jgi:hypothetical protein